MNTRIKELREALKLSQTDFASRLSLTQNFIWMVESGKRDLSDRTIQSICREFDVSETWLRTGEGEMFAPLSREAEIGRLVGKMLRDRDESFRSALILALLRIPPESSLWDDLEELFRSVAKKEDPKG